MAQICKQAPVLYLLGNIFPIRPQAWRSAHIGKLLQDERLYTTGKMIPGIGPSAFAVLFASVLHSEYYRTVLQFFPVGKLLIHSAMKIVNGLRKEVREEALKAAGRQGSHNPVFEDSLKSGPYNFFGGYKYL